MRTIIIFIFAILVAGTAKCEAQVAPTTDVTLHMKPVKGGMVLSFNYDTGRILVSDSALKRFKFAFGDGSEIKIDLTNQSKSKFNRILRKLEQYDYMHLVIKGGFHNNATRGFDRIYKYML